MKIFLSYASKYRAIADDLCCRLQAVGHEVFFDREDLRAGASFDDRIRSAIEDCELFIFLISPEAVAAGHYTRTEVKIASRKWPTPGWHVLPVQVAETPLADIPAYLRALTIMQAEGNLAAEVVLEVEDRVRANSVEPQRPEPKPPNLDSAPDSGPAPSEPAGVHYRSMQLRFARDTAGGYSIAVPEAPGGGRDAQSFALDTPALESALWSGAQPIVGSARRSMNDAEIDALLPAATNAREVGQALYAALFASPLRACFEESLRAIDPQRGEGLRFVINTTDAPDLARLPWEFLYSPAKDDFLFSDRMKPVVRWLDVDEPPPTLAVKPPLRLLIAIAAPADRPGLKVGEEIARLDHALDELTSSGRIETVRLDHATLESLDSALLQTRPHILHFIGHGDFVGDEGMLVLESDTVPGTADTIAGRQFAVLLRNHLTSLRLVFLNSCMGATSSRRDPFGGVAQSLIRRGIPAVIAMQFPIPDKAAVALARHFYRYLAAGQPVDAALTSARAFLYARGFAVEWGAPALHMRTPDGRLFDLAAAPRTPAVARMAPADEPQSAAAPPQSPPTSVTLSQPVSDEGSKRRNALAAIVGIALLGTAALWFTASKESTPEADQLPGPPVLGAPAPMPALPAPIQARPIDQAMARLQAGDSAGAAELLLGIIGQDQAALTRERLGAAHAPLAQTLGDAAERAFIAGDFDLGRRLVDLLGAMSPFDAALDARLRTQIEPWLAEAAVEEIVVEAPAAAIAAAGIDIGGFMVYTVRRGDTLWGIARRLTGDGRNWPQLLSGHYRAVEVGLAVASRIADPARIRPGQNILVPLSPSAGFRAVEYHVARGESLSAIALRIYGDAQMWRAIYRDNERQLPNPDLIEPGQVLILRPRVPQ
ncbi:Peptidoglycan-binding lysin domain protein [Candidatus Propionivibrio aalborgensis]|uniref:Peptidoglycan-binding lysin domain protein n=1 Tax=Candidatus Propionivibrio aalborgensis TaxID=1860101 RepID=A0A1A8Y0T3_9RHOO|nr:Peptidoglycan-binding lysin domain protein [Candidatus Propionivibrio aalborgensis]